MGCHWTSAAFTKFSCLNNNCRKKIKNTEKTILNFRIVSNDNEEFQTRKLFSVNMGKNWFGTIC